MDIHELKAFIQYFNLESLKVNYGYKRVLVQLFGYLGHGKSSFINSCKYVLDGGPYENCAGAGSSDEGRTTKRISYKLTDRIILVDNRGCATMSSYETGEIFAQLVNLLPLDQTVEWSKGFQLVNRIVEAESEVQKSDFIFPVFIYSLKMGIYEQDIGNIGNLLVTAQKLTGMFPFVVLTHKTHGKLTEIESIFQDMGAERIFAFENYTPEDHFKTRGKHEEVLKFFNEVIKEVHFLLEQPRIPEIDFKQRKQLVLKFIYDREMESQRDHQEERREAERIYHRLRMDSMHIKSKLQIAEEKRTFEEEMKKLEEKYEALRLSDNQRFMAEMREFERQMEKKYKKDNCRIQ
ncbi:uncharacterized protein [Hyperolius riggenbachi]|uniref:uncharacterized protein n=1 Tax=Hyperolius riggenbachi TaxID=752182 RepID=UPI0035A26CF1